MIESPWISDWRWRSWLYACLFFSGGLWGITPSLAKIAVAGGGHALGLTLWQAIGGGLTLLVVTQGLNNPLALGRPEDDPVLEELARVMRSALAGDALPAHSAG